jgi:hypothetical protein
LKGEEEEEEEEVSNSFPSMAPSLASRVTWLSVQMLLQTLPAPSFPSFHVAGS